MESKSSALPGSSLDLLLQRPAPEHYLTYWQDCISLKKEERQPAHKDAYIVFRIGADYFSLLARFVGQISLFKSFHRIPHVSIPYIAGLVNVNGRLRLLISLENLLQLQEPIEKKKEGFLITVEDPEAPWAFMVTEVLGLFYMTPASIQAPSATGVVAASHYIKGMLSCNGRSVSLLDEQLLLLGLRRNL